MGFFGAVQWWDEWQLRILVLGSLFIQYFLFFSSMVRRYNLPSWLRLFMWLAYLGGDALATLFNRHKQPPADGSSLEVLWTLVLLIHLGGQHPMTAYNIEDNELWTWHAITVVSQVTVALYVFCKSWSEENRLLQAAILLFVVGIVRSVQKPWALKKASISGMVASSSPSTRREQGSFASYLEGCISFQGTELSKGGRQEEEAEEKDILLEEFVQEASRCILHSELDSDQRKAKELASPSMDNFHHPLLHKPQISWLQRSRCQELVLGYVRDGWQGYIHDTASYKRFNSHRGEWTLNKHHLGHAKRLGWSLKMAFDRSILLWHIATDLCFHHQSTTPSGQERAAQSRVISNHMAYLLSIRPEMLMLGTRNGIFSIACDDIELMMGGELEPDIRGLAQGILHRAQQPPSSHASKIGALVPNGCRLAKALMGLHDEEERWEVIQGVWVEMLCYSAGRCRGYLHAKNMNEGPELLSHVWILLSLMGMETSADRYRKSEPPETNEEEEEEEEEGGDDGGEGRSIEHKINISL